MVRLPGSRWPRYWCGLPDRRSHRTDCTASGVGARLAVHAHGARGAIFIAVSQTVFQNGLIDTIKADNIGIDPTIFLNSGASEIEDTLRKMGRLDALDTVLEAYMKGLRDTFYISLACAACALISCLFFQWKSVKKGPDGEDRKAEPAVPV